MQKRWLVSSVVVLSFGLHSTSALAQALPQQILLNAASWVFQKMMDSPSKPGDLYSNSNHYDNRSYDASAFEPREQFAPRDQGFAPTPVDSSTAYKATDASE